MVYGGAVESFVALVVIPGPKVSGSPVVRTSGGAVFGFRLVVVIGGGPGRAGCVTVASSSRFVAQRTQSKCVWGEGEDGAHLLTQALSHGLRP